MAAVTSMSHKKHSRLSPKKSRSPKAANNLTVLWARFPSIRTSRRLTVLMVIGILLIMGLFKLYDPSTLPIRSVKINGNYAHISNSKLRQTMMPYVHGGFFSVSINELQQKLLQLPWVKSAEVRRIWPATLSVTLQQRTAIAQWGESALLAEDGVAFMPEPASFPAHLPRLKGPEGQAVRVHDAFTKMSAVLSPLGLTIVEMTLTPRQAWHLRLNNGIRLLLGRIDWMARLSRFAQAYPAALKSQASRVESVDLRYSNGMAVQWRQTPKHRASKARRRHGKQG